MIALRRIQRVNRKMKEFGSLGLRAKDVGNTDQSHCITWGVSRVRIRSAWPQKTMGTVHAESAQNSVLDSAGHRRREPGRRISGPCVYIAENHWTSGPRRTAGKLLSSTRHGRPGQKLMEECWRHSCKHCSKLGGVPHNRREWRTALKRIGTRRIDQYPIWAED